MLRTGCGCDLWRHGPCSDSQSYFLCLGSTLCSKLQLPCKQLICLQGPADMQRTSAARHNVASTHCSALYLQAEFSMSLPDMGLLQSAALVGYLLGQVQLTKCHVTMRI